MRRRVISIKTIVDSTGEERVLALCDDGTIWIYDNVVDEFTWHRLADIPQEDE